MTACIGSLSIMDIESDRMKKFVKKSVFDSEINEKKIGFENLTSIEAFQQGKFPEELVEKFKTPEVLQDKSLFADIEAKHKELLEGRPLPELLENSELIGNLEEIKPPTMGKLYEEKRSKEPSLKDKRTTE